MSRKFYGDLLVALKKANKTRKVILAERAGYSTVEDYESFLKNQMNIFTDEPSTRPVIHVVDVVDCSFSMIGYKIASANEGVKLGLSKLQESSDDVDYTYTSCVFSNVDQIKFIEVNTPIRNVKFKNFGVISNTALYTAIIQTIEKVESFRKDSDKVLINIYTDGQDNDSTRGHKELSAKLIEDTKKKGYTISFIGTSNDVNNVIRNLNVEESNTAVYDGSAVGLTNVMNATFESRSAYTASVIKGEDVSRGFYKNIKKK